MLFRTIFLVAVVIAVSLNLYPQSPICKDETGTRNCCGVTRIEDCPVEGCGGDPELNKKKNRTDLPTIAAEPKTFTQLTSFTHPAAWTSGQSRALLETWGEGRNIQLTGYVFEADNYTQGKETTNCSLSTSDFNDFHIVLVENLILANKPRLRTTRLKKPKTLSRMPKPVGMQPRSLQQRQNSKPPRTRQSQPTKRQKSVHSPPRSHPACVPMSPRWATAVRAIGSSRCFVSTPANSLTSVSRVGRCSTRSTSAAR